jgi:hypothetical protein
MNNSNSTLILVSILVAGFNILLVVHVAILMFPVFSKVTVFRPEYGFAAVSVVVLIGAVVHGYVPDQVLFYIALHQ